MKEWEEEGAEETEEGGGGSGETEVGQEGGTVETKEGRKRSYEEG